MAAVDEHGQLDRRRAAEVGQRVQRGADGAARVEHVVDEDDGASLHRHRQVCRLDVRRARGDVVAVEADVQGADGHALVLDLADRLRQAVRQRNAPRAHADKHDVAQAVVAFHDLVGDAPDGAADFFRGEDCARDQ